jgi:hypothetical protein
VDIESLVFMVTDGANPGPASRECGFRRIGGVIAIIVLGHTVRLHLLGSSGFMG